MSAVQDHTESTTIADRTADVIWKGSLAAGHGRIRSGSGAFSGQEVTWVARTAQPGGKTSPEELCAAAHAACFSMALALALGEHRSPPDQLEVQATVTLVAVGGVPTITSSALEVTAAVVGIDQAAFDAILVQAAELCPVSRLFAGAQITVDARLAGARTIRSGAMTARGVRARHEDRPAIERPSAMARGSGEDAACNP